MTFYHFYPKERKKLLIVTNWHDQTEYVIHTINLNQALNHGLILKKVHRVIGKNLY